MLVGRDSSWGKFPGAHCASLTRQGEYNSLVLRGVAFRQNVEGFTQVILLFRVRLILVSLLQAAAGTRPSEADGQIVLDILTWGATTVPIAKSEHFAFPSFSLFLLGNFF